MSMATPFSYSLGTDSTNGSVDLQSDGSFTYTPNLNYNGPDSFTFIANDGTVDSAPAHRHHLGDLGQ